MRRYLILFNYLLFLLPLPVLGAGVVINEIAWMGSLPKSGETIAQAANKEWIELKNTGASPVSLDGWKLTAEDGTPDIVLVGTIDPYGFFLLERTSDDTVLGVKADQIYVGAISNSGEVLILRDAAGNEVDKVDGSDGWKVKGTDKIAGDNETKETAQLLVDGWTTALPTPRAENIATAVVLSAKEVGTSPIQNLNSGSAVLSTAPAPLPAIKVYAGEDKIVAVGSLTDFIGEALSFKNEPLENPRFWWNFGDGDNKEGRIVSHIFQAPGKYMVGLHVSSGSNAASDYLKVEVVPNQIKVKSVLMGRGGYLALFNPADADIDIGEWMAEDGAGRKFFIPSKTKIGARSEISLVNQITGILLDGEERLVLRYPNSIVAKEWQETATSTNPYVEAEALPVNPVAKTEVKKKAVPATDFKASASSSTLTESAQVSPGFKVTSGPSPKIFFWSAATVSLLAAVLFLFVRSRL